jgi:hypothetical protein
MTVEQPLSQPGEIEERPCETCKFSNANSNEPLPHPDRCWACKEWADYCDRMNITWTGDPNKISGYEKKLKIPYYPEFLHSPLTKSEFNFLVSFFCYCVAENIDTFTIDDVRDFTEKRGISLYGHAANEWGIMLSKAKYQRLVEEVDRRPSSRAENHGRKVGVYRRL